VASGQYDIANDKPNPQSLIPNPCVAHPNPFPEGEGTSAIIEVINVQGRAKNRVPTTQAALESEILYPLVRSADLHRWAAVPKIMILLAQDPDKRIGICPAVMAERYPHAQAYLARFEPMLRARAAFRRYFRESDPYWTMFNVGRYTLADWKVVWHRMGGTMRAAVCGPIDGKPAIPQETLCFVAAGSRREAHYLCAALNSAPFHVAVRSYSQMGGKSFASPHILENLRVPAFDINVPLHRELSECSISAHGSAAAGERAAIRETEFKLAAAAGALWDLSTKESAEIRRSLGQAGLPVFGIAE
jgi:hypothetical protein